MTSAAPGFREFSGLPWRLSLLLCCLPLPLTAQAGLDNAQAIAEVFAQHGVADGTFVALSVDGDERHVFNQARAEQRYTPASTVKVLNTLIGLDSGIIVAGTVFRRDGVNREIAAWNADQTLQSAFAVSCAWCYQKVARTVGAARYRETLYLPGYGNARVGERVDRFWLDGSLRISALEQAAFLKSLAVS